MCITSGPAKLSNTKIMSFPLESGRFMFSYANTVNNGTGSIFDKVLKDKLGIDMSTANSMILPIPGEVREEWFYDTTNYNDFLKDIEEFHKPKTRSLSFRSKGVSNSVSVFDNGMYTVVVSKDVDAIKGAIETLPEEKRPEIKEELLDFFGTHYEGWSFVICCFSGGNEMSAQPIMFEYTPMYPEFLFYPGVDSHDGGAPKMGKQVAVDHCLISHGIQKKGYLSPNFSQDVPLVLQRTYRTSEESGSRLNGDWYMKLGEEDKGFVRKGTMAS